jgi:hypothetical protein
MPAYVAAGRYIEKGDGSPQFGPVNREQWDWPRLLELLADPERRAALETVVVKHDLRIGDYLGGGFTPKGAVMGFRARLEDGELVLRNRWRPAPDIRLGCAARSALDARSDGVARPPHLARVAGGGGDRDGAAVRAPGGRAGADRSREGVPGHGVATRP